MELTINDLVLTGRTHDHPYASNRTGMLIPLRRGVYLPASVISNALPRWEVARLLHRARAYATALALAHDPPVFTLETALELHGLPTWDRVPRISFRRLGHANSTRSTRLAPITYRQLRLSATRERRIRSVPQVEDHVVVQGVRTAPLVQIAIDCARYLHPLPALVAVSGVLRRLSVFDRRHLDESRKKEAAAKNELLQLAKSMKGASQIRQTRAIIRSADAGVESPGEAAILWLLRCITPSSQVETQHRVIVDGKTYFGDVALPAHRLIVEFDGYAKTTSREREFIDRQRHLVQAGWTLIRIEHDQLRDFMGLISYLVRELRRHGVPAGQPQGALWKFLSDDVVVGFFAY